MTNVYNFNREGDWSLTVKSGGTGTRLTNAIIEENEGKLLWRHQGGFSGHKFVIWRKLDVRQYAGQEIEVLVRLSTERSVQLLVGKDVTSKDSCTLVSTMTDTKSKSKILKGTFVASKDTATIGLSVKAGNLQNLLCLSRMLIAVGKEAP